MYKVVCSPLAAVHEGDSTGTDLSRLRQSQGGPGHHDRVHQEKQNCKRECCVCVTQSTPHIHVYTCIYMPWVCCVTLLRRLYGLAVCFLTPMIYHCCKYIHVYILYMYM